MILLEYGLLLPETNDTLKVKGGQEIRLHSNPTTRKTGNISQGNRIVATVNDQNHIRSIRLTDMADMGDRRNEQTGRTMDLTIETRTMGSMGQ